MFDEKNLRELEEENYCLNEELEEVYKFIANYLINLAKRGNYEALNLFFKNLKEKAKYYEDIAWQVVESLDSEFYQNLDLNKLSDEVIKTLINYYADRNEDFLLAFSNLEKARRREICKYFGFTLEDFLNSYEFKKEVFRLNLKEEDVLNLKEYIKKKIKEKYIKPIYFELKKDRVYLSYYDIERGKFKKLEKEIKLKQIPTVRL